MTLSYGPGPNDVIDVRLPSSPPTGVIVMLHGGFWRAEYDRMHTGPMATALAAAGYIVAVPEFRRTGCGGGWPSTFDDVAAALDAAPGLLAPYSSSPPVLVGHSAGGHLALWAATRPGAWATSVVSLAGCADLALCSRLDLDEGATDLLMGGSPEEVPERYALADPTALPVPTVPVTLVHGTADDRVPIEVSRSYAARTDAALRELPEVGHFALIDPLSMAWPAVREAIDQR